MKHLSSIPSQDGYEQEPYQTYVSLPGTQSDVIPCLEVIFTTEGSQSRIARVWESDTKTIGLLYPSSQLPENWLDALQGLIQKLKEDQSTLNRMDNRPIYYTLPIGGSMTEQKPST